MKVLILFFFLKIFCGQALRCKASAFTAVGSRNLRANLDYEVAVSSHSLKDFVKPLHLYIEIKGTNTNLLEDVWVEKGRTRTIRFKTSGLIPGKYQLSITEPSTGFNDSSSLNYLAKTYTMFIQTDKPIYKVEDDVNFRVYAYDSQTLPYNMQEMAKCTVTDGATNRMFEWKDVKFENGVYEKTFTLPSRVVYGIWTINCEGPNKEYTNQQIEVAEYVLPFCSISLSGPTDIAKDAGSFPITAKAVYSSGKPAAGNIKLSCSFYLPDGEQSFEKNAQTTGDTTFDISLSKDMKISQSTWDAYVYCKVDFVDDFTRKTVTDSKTYTVHMFKYTIDYSAQYYYYRKGIPFTYILTVKRIDGTPVGLEAKYEDRKIIVNNDIYYLNERGEVTMEIKNTPANGTTILIKAVYKDVIYETNIYNNYDLQTHALVINQKTRNPKLEDFVHFDVLTSEDVKFAFCHLYSKSILRRNFKVDIYSKVGSFNFKVTFDDAPDTKIVCFYIASDDSIVGDAIDLYFRNELSNSVDFLIELMPVTKL